jgi:PAS domain S-box-containing protein
MSVNLINVMASKEELNREVEERKRAEKAIRESEEHFKLLAQNAPVAIFVQTQHQFAYLNPEALNLFGAKNQDQLLGQPVINRFDPSYHDIVKERIHLLNEDKKPVGMMDEVYLKLDGSPFDAAVSAAPIRWRGHDGAIVFFRDVTERKRARQELWQSELRLSRAELLVGLGNWEIDLSTKKVIASDGARQIYGVGQQELTLDDIWKFPLPEHRSRLDKAFFALIDDGEPYDIEFKIMRANDDQVINIHSIAHYDTEKNSVFGTIHDITGLRHAEERYGLLFAAIEQAAEGVVITDNAGIIQYVNPAEETISGYSNDELVGRKPSIFKSGKHDDNFYKNLWKTINADNVWCGRFVNRKKDGTEYHEDATISPVYDKSGNLTNFVAVKHDVTQRVSLQEQLFQAQKMEAIGTLAGGFAHDFRNMLQVVMGSLELIEFNKDLPEHLRTDLDRIRKAATSGAELVKGMLVFSRKTSVQLEPLNLNKLVESVESLLARSIPKMIKIDVVKAHDLSSIKGDSTQIEQILMNLAINASDAMPDGGTLTIQTMNTVLDEKFCRSHPNTRPGAHVLLSVTDTGTGMNEETVRRIFEPFFTTKEKGKGTGLGLAVVYGIVEQHSARIICESKPSVGTTFKIYFPAVEEIQEEKYLEKKEPPRGQGETILLVDDAPEILEMATRLLNDANYRVIAASNAKDALELYEKHRCEIRLVLLDLIMPEIGGKQCLEALRNMDPNVKVLVITGYTQRGMTQELTDAGARDFILKPFDTPQLLEKIRKIIDEGLP